MENTVSGTTQEQPFNRFAIAIRWGIIWGILSCILITVQHMFFIERYGIYMTFMVLTFILGLVLYCVAGIQQRKAMGGYISFKDAFQVIFVVILISSLISGIYSFVYFKYIDPEAIDKLKNATLTAMQNWGAPESSIDEAEANFEKGAGNMEIGTVFLNFLKGVIFNSIFGFICAAIVKKKKPEFGA